MNYINSIYNYIGKTVELDEQQGKNQELNNPMIYSEDTKDLSVLLSHNLSPAFKKLLQKH